MIKIVKRGDYQLMDILGGTKVFVLDSAKAFIWEDTSVEFFEYNPKNQTEKITLSKGKYFLYDVHDERKFTDSQHLELFLGKHTWQGYLLPEGIPTRKQKRKQIIPVEEIITKTM